jgi:hypothetical protein
MRLLAALLALTLIAGNVQRADASTPTTKRKQAISARRSPQVLIIHSMDACPACVALERFIVKAGSKVAYDAKGLYGASQRPCVAFPTVAYSDGAQDNGERIYKGAVKLPKVVRFDKWRP